MPLSRNFLPIVFNGIKFDRGMQLYELSSQRSEPDAALESYTGAYKDCGRFVSQVERFVRERVEMVEVPAIKVLWFGECGNDAFISNNFEGWKDGARSQACKVLAHKILCLPYSVIAPGYYRAAWLPPPEIWPSLKPAKFHYPACGYAGVLAEMLGESIPSAPALALDTVGISIAFLTGYPSQMQESVIFVVDESPIYRVTNQEVCAGRYFEKSRLVVEFRGECDVVEELERLNICHGAKLHGQTTINYPLPTKENLLKCPTLYTNSLNDQIIRHLLSQDLTPRPGSTT